MKRSANQRQQPAAPAEPPTRDAMDSYWALVDEICLGDRAEFREANKSRAEIEAILAAAGKKPYQLAADCDDLRGRWR